VIHTQTPFLLDINAIAWAKKMGCPLVHTYHTLFESYLHYVSFIPRRLSLAFTEAFSRWYCHKMDLVVAPSTQMKEVLDRYRIKTPIEVIPTGYKADIFKPVPAEGFRQKYDIREDAPLLLFAGRVAKEKNIPFLFEVLKKVRERLPDTVLFIAGDGPAHKELVQLAEKEGLSEAVRFPGYFAQEDLATCYAAADIFVFASVTETQGLVVIEAMAVGTPVVAISEMGIAEVMATGQGGYAVEMKVDQFTDKVLLLLTDKKVMASKKEEALAFAQEWSADTTSQKMLNCYEDLVSKKSVI
jgi:glycosyltransferase involved in cell wall biosynthesis